MTFDFTISGWIFPFNKNPDRCQHYLDLRELFRNDDTLVAYVVAYTSYGESKYEPLEASICPERLAVAAQEYYAAERAPYGRLEVFFENLHGDADASLERLHEKIGIKMSFPPRPLKPRAALLRAVESLIKIVPSIPDIQSIYLVGSVARGASASKDVDLLVVSNSCPFQGLEGKLDESLDFFCFNPAEFTEITSGSYQITDSMQLLYQKA
jgi:hypothetical protein